MKKKSSLQTIRLQPSERRMIERYMAQNPVFDSFSALARVAILTWVGQENLLRLVAVPAERAKVRPRFLWDYDLSEAQVREIIHKPGLSSTKQWLLERILTQARFDEVLEYVDLKELPRVMGHLKLPEKVKERWKYALQHWSQHG